VAHDFNNLLTVIAAYSGLLLEAGLGDADRRSAREIADAAVRAAALTRQLLLFSRKQVVQHQRLELGEVIAGLEPMLSRLLYENIALVTNLDAGSTAIFADKSQIEQIIVNLAVNASDAMPDGGTLTIESTTVGLDETYNQMHTEVKPGRYVMLAVSDTGIGMDPATMGKVFEPFFTTKPVGQGTGLGLATVYAVVKELGGHIWVYSELGSGTTFKVYLQAAALGEDTRAPAIATVAAPHAAAEAETVLLVEDDDAVRRATRSMLERAKFTVLEAADGKAGLALAEQYRDRLDVVVTDLMMPGMDGRAFAEALHRTHPELRVVFVSGYTDDAVVRRNMIDSNQAFLQKPFSAQELTATIRKVLHPDG
jgi:two-component system cell cycle sensor histidine kinase/response regulator CckA